MRRGEWTRWNTPRLYKNLDGTGRKMLLYDKTRKGITVEVEIAEVKRTDAEPKFPWSNYFVQDTLVIFPRPIPLDHIRAVPGLDKFGIGQSAFRNITHEQYRKLKAAVEQAPLAGIAADIPPIPESRAQELARRIARADAEPGTSIPLEQLRAELEMDSGR